MSILDKFIEIEEKEEIFNFSFSYKNTLMYPFIRFHLLQSAIEDTLKIHSPYDPLHIRKTQKIEYYIKSFLYSIPYKIKSDIIFFGTDISNILKGNAYYNRLTETFANEYPDKTILIEESHNMDYKRPRTYPKVFARDFVNIMAKIKTKWIKINQKDLTQIQSFIMYLRKYFSHEFTNIEIWKKIENALIYFSKNIPFFYIEYKRMLSKLSPKIIFLEDACYGSDHIFLIMAAKELKISVGEYQHGLISLTHPAYNYSAHLHDSYKYYMPDFYMCWGKYWAENSRIPIKTIKIGNPYLSDTISHQGQNYKKEQLLYISSAINPECYVEEVILLSKKLNNNEYSVIFRIHPSETNRLQTVYKPIVDAVILIDTKQLYETLKDIKYIIGDYSTVLFEAIMFNCVIFIKDTNINNENVEISQFNVYQSIEEIVEKINSKNYKKTNPDNFWADNWRVEYHKLIDSFLIK